MNEGGVRHAVTGTASSNRVTTLGYRAAVVRMRFLLGVMWGNFRRILFEFFDWECIFYALFERHSCVFIRKNYVRNAYVKYFTSRFDLLCVALFISLRYCVGPGGGGGAHPIRERGPYRRRERALWKNLLNNLEISTL